ncbi:MULTISPECIES: pre-peptidase C-terminal domain-containing protein [Desulfococcus]|uniref:Peptidase M12A astacin n=1 Tax=Desulfococcus multivorans DSM 2059 TaxID=1121405 RepID=S7TUR5_DESML|nr:pre-peptidase C-terminal domain-containing protein [Desulfococcus multivorans]AOY57060.1 putative peptidase, M12A family [Desulfococcus multivorans]AQU99574.1 peptidase [Desulfococcus multivorans]EPR40741.1 peptidase M12A astacin [Desulfococcus multivorans DSM 2059]SJZ88458.1 pre-peptidase C-terminal domain-containing protein [Desulfococcus multivorans DSM 2059]
MSDIKKICFDRILARDLHRAILFRNIEGTTRTRAISPIGKLWPNGSTLRVSFLGGTAQQHDVVKTFAPQWSRFANLNFDFGTAPDADIRIAFADDGAWSYLGTDAKGIHVSRPTMNYGWLDEAVVLHEFGHAIGLAHEHQNPEEGIKWNEEAVIRDLSGPPNYWDIATIRHNVLNKYAHDQINGTVFDPDAVMLYAFPREWTLDGFQTKENKTLSAMEKAFVAGEKMYPGRGSQPDAVELDVLEFEGTPASIGLPGEEDLFTFMVKSPGRYTIETEGETDLVMKLYGPDNRTNLIAEDDDSGKGYNPRIGADLIPGRYLVQIRHYNRTGGTGDYTIKVYK